MKKSIQHYMRALHRDIGFIVIGLTIIYTLSGIVLIFRASNFMKFEKQIEVQLEPNLEAPQLGAKLKMRNFKIIEQTDQLYVFNSGSYNFKTGMVAYTKMSHPTLIEKFNRLHMASNKSKVYWATTIYGVLLLFLAISSFWMFKPKSKLFKRGIVLSAMGLVFALVLLMF